MGFSDNTDLVIESEIDCAVRDYYEGRKKWVADINEDRLKK